MTAKTITTKTGTVTVEITRYVVEQKDADFGIVYGKETIDRTVITLRDHSGKTLAKDNCIRDLHQKFDAKFMAQGAVGKINNAYIGQETYDLISNLIAEVDAETPKSEEQIAIETAKANQIAENEAWHNSPEQVSYRKFAVEMDSEDSDY
jgi:hypothetical protein